MAGLLSWGNLWMELILPWAAIVWMENGFINTIFHISGVGFHAGIYAIMGPNFLHYCLLHLLASDPLGWPVWARYVKRFQPGQRVEESASPPAIMTRTRMITWRDWMHVIVAFCVIFGWFRLNFLSDIYKLMGTKLPKTDYSTKKMCGLDLHDKGHSWDGIHFDKYLPFSEVSMFTYRTKESNYKVSLFLLVLTFCIYAYAMGSKRSKTKGTVFKYGAIGAKS
jgi:hypothetical protein